MKGISVWFGLVYIFNRVTEHIFIIYHNNYKQLQLQDPWNEPLALVLVMERDFNLAIKIIKLNALHPYCKTSNICCYWCNQMSYKTQIELIQLDFFPKISILIKEGLFCICIATET